MFSITHNARVNAVRANLRLTANIRHGILHHVINFIRMKLTTRLTHNFAEIKVDEIEVIIFKDSEAELKNTIQNLLQVAHELTSYTDESIHDFINELIGDNCL